MSNEQTAQNPARFAVIEEPAEIVAVTRLYPLSVSFDRATIVDLQTGAHFVFDVMTPARLERTIDALRVPAAERGEDEIFALSKAIAYANYCPTPGEDPISFKDEAAADLASQYRNFVESAGGYTAAQSLADLISQAGAAIRSAIEAKDEAQKDPDAYAAKMERAADEAAAREEEERAED